MSFVVIACSRCRNAWSVDVATATSRCQGCGRQTIVASRRRLWQGDDARAAATAAGAIRAAIAQGRPPDEAATVAAALAPPARDAKHDSPLDAAAAKARAFVNQSQRAEAVALWLTRLIGAATEDDYVAALRRAGLSGRRAEKEIIRMLACDVIIEPAPGRYRALGA